ELTIRRLDGTEIRGEVKYIKKLLSACYGDLFYLVKIEESRRVYFLEETWENQPVIEYKGRRFNVTMPSATILANAINYK
ncbi:hypothetical protein ACI3PL_30620, partial [Lacticaseibacillus paracasei]